MVTSPDPAAVAHAAKDFLDAMAADGALLAWYLTNRDAAIEDWFSTRIPIPYPQDVAEAAELLLKQGNFPALQKGLAPAAAGASWVTIWVTGASH